MELEETKNFENIFIHSRKFNKVKIQQWQNVSATILHAASQAAAPIPVPFPVLKTWMINQQLAWRL